MSGITFTGIGSGIAVGEIVSAFVEAERVPFQNRINEKGSALTTDISANGTLKSVLSSLASSLEALTDVDSYQQRAASGGDDFITITADKDAVVGSYDIQVNNLSQAHKVISAPFSDSAAIGEGVMTFSTVNDADGFSVDVSDTDTLSDIRDKINESSDNEIMSASIITDSDGNQSLVMNSTDTGVDNQLSITATQADGTTPLDSSSELNNLLTFIDPASRGAPPADTVESNLIEIKAALDASITIDGQITVTSANNEFNDAIDGISLTAKQAQGVDDDVSTVSVSENNSLVSSTLSKFVDSYNEYYDIAKQLGQSGEDGAGPMAGDAMLRTITSKMRSMLSQSFNTGEEGGALALSQLGIESDQYGVLTLDTSVFNDKLAEDPAAIQSFFIGTDDEPGFAVSTDNLLQNYVKTGGLIDTRITGFEGQLDDLEDDMATFTLKIEKYEARLTAQYNAMDILVAQLNATSSYVTAQLENMPGVVSQNN